MSIYSLPVSSLELSDSSDASTLEWSKEISKSPLINRKQE